MQILAHRGFWKKPAEKNSPAALRRALSAGYGVETDLRDAAGRLVISHDPPKGKVYAAEKFFALAHKFGITAPLALNLKADGLRAPLKSLLQKHRLTNYFCFDMSAPETLACARDGLRFFTRHSEIEPRPILYAEAAGVWMDMFRSDWIKPADVRRHLKAGKQVALVSPELHRRPHLTFWRRLRAAGLARDPRVLLCTDFPDEAARFFHD